MNTFTIIAFVLMFLYIIYSNGKSRRLARERTESVKQSLRDRINNMDRHHHDMIHSNHKKVGKDFNRFLSLVGYKRMDLNSEENLVLVEDFKGRLFMAEDTLGAKFVPVTELTQSEGVRSVKYQDKVLIFKPEVAKAK